MSMSVKYLVSKRAPDCCYSYFHAFRVGDENLEQFEEVLHVVLDSIDDGFQHGEEDVYANFALRNLWRSRCLVEP